MIFGIGLSKTGTTSLYAALHQLGYRSGTYGHMAELGLQDWFRGDFTRDYLDGYDAVTDLPLGVFYRQLDKRYPGSKFILTVRDIDAWLESARKQFSRRPAPPPGFNRDVRLASYGMTGFDEDRYRFVYHTHLENVGRYFRDRPGQLLVMDITAGDGWEKLCSYLGKRIRRTPFPNVKPGWRPPEKSSPARWPFVFVVPVSNPKNENVQDYATVEALLARTVRSLLEQSRPDVAVVVVCHGKPRNAMTADPRVVYLDVSSTGVFPPNVNSLQIDKGLRYIIGAAFAIREFKPDLLMPMDADDYVNTRLADLAVSEWRRRRDVDGFLVDSGVEVQITIGPRRSVKYEKAIIVDGFNYTCGSCRIFSVERLRARLDRISPDLLNGFTAWKAAGKGAFHVPPTAVRRLYGMTFRSPGKPGPAYELVHVIGRHVRQRPEFNLFPLAILGAAKSCGHANHAGPQAGAVHENQAIGTLSIAAFKRMFGVDGGKDVRSGNSCGAAT